MLGQSGASSERSRVRPRSVGLLFGTAVAVGLAAACSSTSTATRSNEFTTTTSTTRAIASGPNEAWCKKWDGVPDVLGSFANQQTTDYTPMVATFTELRDGAPEPVKADFVLLVDFVTKANDASKAGTLGTTTEQKRQWLATTFGADGSKKVFDALEHIATVDAQICGGSPASTG